MQVWQSQEPFRNDFFAGLENKSENNAVSKFDIEKLVHHIGNLHDSSNTIKYPVFSAFMKCVLSISHENSAPESRFSINKHILDIHGGYN